jgi:hypothetical protein
MIRPEAGVRIAGEYDSFPAIFCQTFFHLVVTVIVQLTRVWQPKISVTSIEVEFWNELPTTTSDARIFGHQ